jgi:hypothetical protein
MTLELYRGLVPSNVSKDAKYTVTAAGEVRLTYRVDEFTRELLTTAKHPRLVEMVNAVKSEMGRGPGGVFYINEFCDVLVPGELPGTCYWAGHYQAKLQFDFGGSKIGSKAPRGLAPGDEWPGPHPGVRYILCVGGRDIRYELRVGNRVTKVFLSSAVGRRGAEETSARVAAVKGHGGGRFYINESSELFGPVVADDFARFLYIGHLEESAWFDPPDDYDRP